MSVPSTGPSRGPGGVDLLERRRDLDDPPLDQRRDDPRLDGAASGFRRRARRAVPVPGGDIPSWRAAAVDPPEPRPDRAEVLAAWGGRRYRLTYRHELSRSIAGVCWFLVLAGMVALAVVRTDATPVAAVFAFVAALAGYQTAARWRDVGVGANRLLAGAGALAMGFGALEGPGRAGLAAAALVVLAVLDAGFAPSLRAGVAAAGSTALAGVLPGFGAASMVFVADAEVLAVAILATTLVFYDAGDYVNGGDHSVVEGPLWGILSALIVTAVVATWVISPFTSPVPAWVFGGMAAVLAPLGQLAASAVLPTAAAPAPALRRIDSALLVAPVWAWAMWSYLGL